MRFPKLNFRQRRVERTRRRLDKTEHRVAVLTEFIRGLDGNAWPEEMASAREERAQLWIARTQLLQKLDQEA